METASQVLCPASMSHLINALLEEQSEIPINTPKPFGKASKKSWSFFRSCEGDKHAEGGPEQHSFGWRGWLPGGDEVKYVWCLSHRLYKRYIGTTFLFLEQEVSILIYKRSKCWSYLLTQQPGFIMHRLLLDNPHNVDSLPSSEWKMS